MTSEGTGKTGARNCMAVRSKLFLQVGLDIPALVIRHGHHNLEQSIATEREDFRDLRLREAAELDIAERAHGRNNGAGAAGLLIGTWRTL